MDNTARIAVYTRGRTTLTPAQRRRVRKRQNVALSPLVTVRRASRMRKTLELARRRALRRQGTRVVALVRNARGH